MRHLPLFLSISCLLLCLQSYAQTDACGTDGALQVSSDLAAARVAESLLLPRDSGVYEVAVQFHAVGASNGAFALDSAQITAVYDVAQAEYLKAGIQLVQCNEINVVRDNRYLNFTQYEDEALCDEHDVQGAINIYLLREIVDDDGEGTICGYAYNFDISPRLFVKNSCYLNGSTFIHELGHSFSLLHTHSTSRGAELVRRSNCREAGDLLCDTPADPRLSSSVVTTNCVYTGNTRDDEGQLFTPQEENYMSYSRKTCRDQFTTEQMLQMYFYTEEYIHLLDCDGLSTSVIDPSRDAALAEVRWDPIGQWLHVRVSQDDTTIRLYTTQGQQIYSKASIPRSSEIAIETGAFAAGWYVLHVTHQQNYQAHKIYLSTL